MQLQAKGYSYTMHKMSLLWHFLYALLLEELETISEIYSIPLCKSQRHIINANAKYLSA